MKHLLSLIVLLFTSLTLEASTEKSVTLERLHCHFENETKEVCVLYVRDIFNTTGLGLIYHKTDKIMANIHRLRSQVFYLDTKAFKLLPQTPLEEKIYYDQMYFFVLALDDGESSLKF